MYQLFLYTYISNVPFNYIMMINKRRLHVVSSRLDKKQYLGKFSQIHPRYDFLRLPCDQTTNQGTATSNFIY